MLQQRMMESEVIYEILSLRLGDWLDVGGGKQRQGVVEVLCMGDFINSVFV